MQSIQERNFHLLMGGLLITSLFVDPMMRAVLGTWSPPSLGIFPQVVGALWLVRYSAWKWQRAATETRRLRQQIDDLEMRLSARIDALPRDLARVRRLGGGEP